MDYKDLLIRGLRKAGLLLVSRKTLRKQTPQSIAAKYGIAEEALLVLQAHLNGGLQNKLVLEGRTRWLDIGCGGSFEENFTYIDLFPEPLVNKPGRYFRMDIANLTDSDFKRLGKFDMVRMQHVLEHFPPEAGFRVLQNCAMLLKPGGVILITTPDLRKIIQLFLSGNIREDFEWAHKRIDPGSPDSFYFSVYSHSLPHEPHEWCYDAEGIKYQLEKSGLYDDIREIPLNHELAGIPFTHNRPKEDVCVMAQLKCTHGG